MKNNFRSNYDAMKEVRKVFPNANAIPVAAFGISHVITESPNSEKEIAETIYNGIKNNTFVGEGVELKYKVSI